MGKFIDLTGRRFGRLLVIKRSGSNSRKKAVFLCRCDCGVEKELASDHLKAVLSCGCLMRETITKHGNHKHPLYRTWAGMLSRCRDTNLPSYINYGGRGIYVEESWLDFKNFFNDVIKIWKEHVSIYGRKNTSIDRINNDGHYCKENVRFSTNKIQQRNTRKNRYLELDGKKLTTLQISEIKGIDKRTLLGRLDRGWDASRAIVEPVHKKVLFEFQGKEKNLADWAKISGVNYHTLRWRIFKFGWSLEKALETPKLR